MYKNHPSCAADIQLYTCIVTLRLASCEGASVPGRSSTNTTYNTTAIIYEVLQYMLILCVFGLLYLQQLLTYIVLPVGNWAVNLPIV